MANVIVIVVLVALLAAVVRYIHKSRKKGVKCIGCPEGCHCGKSGGCNGCG